MEESHAKLRLVEADIDGGDPEDGDTEDHGLLLCPLPGICL
jgi:hypothetical protein